MSTILFRVRIQVRHQPSSTERRGWLVEIVSVPDLRLIQVLARDLPEAEARRMGPAVALAVDTGSRLQRDAPRLTCEVEP
jgi:hypothetical protein